MEGVLNIFLVTEIYAIRYATFFRSKIPLLGPCINLQVGISSDVYTYIFVIWEIKIKIIMFPS